MNPDQIGVLVAVLVLHVAAFDIAIGFLILGVRGASSDREL